MADISKVNLPSDPNNPYNIKDAYARDQLTTLGGGEDLTDISPYNFRVSGGSLNTSSVDIGNREVDKLIGGTVAFNQQLDLDNDSWTLSNGLSGTAVNGKITLSGTTTYATAFAIYPSRIFNKSKFPEGHKVLVYWTGTHSGLTWLRFGFYGTSNVYLSSPSVVSVPANNTDSEFVAQPTASGTAISVEITTAFAVDLTQMFGSTIADYIYSLEQATAGAGVAYFRNLFPKDYYAYNVGELMSVKTSAHNMVGFNQWNE